MVAAQSNGPIRVPRPHRLSYWAILAEYVFLALPPACPATGGRPLRVGTAGNFVLAGDRHVVTSGGGVREGLRFSSRRAPHCARFTRLAPDCQSSPRFGGGSDGFQVVRVPASRPVGEGRRIRSRGTWPRGSGAAALNVAARAALEPLEGRLLFAVYAVTDLGALGGLRSEAHAINASGQVALDADVTPGSDLSPHSHPALYNGAGLTDLGTLGGADGQAFGINAGGRVVGTSSLPSGVTHAFLYNGTSKIDLGSFSTGGNSTAYAINDTNVVVGSADVAPGSARLPLRHRPARPGHARRRDGLQPGLRHQQRRAGRGRLDRRQRRHPRVRHRRVRPDGPRRPHRRRLQLGPRDQRQRLDRRRGPHRQQQHPRIPVSKRLDDRPGARAASPTAPPAASTPVATSSAGPGRRTTRAPARSSTPAGRCAT